MTVSNKGRRKFRRTEVAWVARLFGGDTGAALRAMDGVYRRALARAEREGDPAGMTWCVVKLGHDVALGLRPEASDIKGRRSWRAFYREA